jgi:hypothetical protein
MHLLSSIAMRLKVTHEQKDETYDTTLDVQTENTHCSHANSLHPQNEPIASVASMSGLPKQEPR